MNQKTVKKHICDRLAHGEPIQTILNPQPKIIRYDDDKEPVYDPDFVKPDLPDWNMVVEWLRNDQQFLADWEHARKMGAAFLADEMMTLKDRVLKDPKNASAYKVAMEMVKTAAMWGDPKYSERTIQELKSTTPQSMEEVSARIKQLEEELGIRGDRTVNVTAVEVKPKRSPAQIAHAERLAALQKARKGIPRGKRKPDAGTDA